MKSVTHLSKVVFLAVVLSFGISYVYAWVAPTSTPPGGNVAAPINIGSVTQTKIGGDICVDISGTVKCLGSATITIPHGMEVFTSNGSFTVPAGVNSLTVDVSGGGGGGGGGLWCPGDCHTSSGGGSGGYVHTIVAVTPGQVIPVVVGNGGNGGAGGHCWVPGAAGSASSFGAISAGGGGGGNWPSGGAAGVPNGVGGSGGSWYSHTSHAGGANASGAGTGGTGYGCFTSGTAGGKGKVVVTW